MEFECIVLILSVSTVLAGANPATFENNLTRDEFIAAINTRAKTWTAGVNPGPVPVHMSSIGKASPVRRRMFYSDPLWARNATDDLPESFDARERWPECPSLRQVRDQGCCGSCYAVAVASAITDRWCIHSNGTQQYTFSSQDAASCCVGCGNCTEGYPHLVWLHWSQHGIVSGGELNSNQGCRPYEVGQCPERPERPERLECVRKCRAGYTVAYEDAKRYGSTAYRVRLNEQMIMLDIFHNGPVSATFLIYSDFYSYRSGVYQHIPDYGEYRGGHVVKVIGWGIENGVKYWLIANSWSSSWGDGGFFKFIRGENHLMLEANVFGGMPRYD